MAGRATFDRAELLFTDIVREYKLKRDYAKSHHWDEIMVPIPAAIFEHLDTMNRINEHTRKLADHLGTISGLYLFREALGPGGEAEEPPAVAAGARIYPLFGALPHLSNMSEEELAAIHAAFLEDDRLWNAVKRDLFYPVYHQLIDDNWRVFMGGVAPPSASPTAGGSGKPANAHMARGEMWHNAEAPAAGMHGTGLHMMRGHMWHEGRNRRY